MKQRNADIGETIIVNLIENCPDMSLEWFILGEGDMIKTSSPSVPLETPSETHTNDLVKPLLDRIEEQAAKIERLKMEVETLKNSAKTAN